MRVCESFIVNVSPATTRGWGQIKEVGRKWTVSGGNRNEENFMNVG